MAKRKVFFSFHYKPDHWRASQVRNIGVIEGNEPCSDNDWESVTGGGEAAIKAWIEGQMKGTSCALVLIGNDTAGRKWIKYEIEKAWNAKKGLLGIYIHNLLDSSGSSTTKGANPFNDFTVKDGTVKLSSVAKAYNPTGSTSKEVYGQISANLSAWIEEAVKIRDEFK
jgi:hypothetical protein